MYGIVQGDDKVEQRLYMPGCVCITLYTEMIYWNKDPVGMGVHVYNVYVSV